MTEMDRVWARMKAAAASLAARDSMPSLMHAHGIVGQIIREEHALSTPAEAREYLAAEFQRLVTECKSAAAS